MAQQLAVEYMRKIGRDQRGSEMVESESSRETVRAAAIQGQSDLTRVENNDQTEHTIINDVSNSNFHNTIEDSTQPVFRYSQHSDVSERRQSYSTIEDSPSQSRSPSPRPSLPSSTTTSSLYTIDSFTGFHAAKVQRPSVLRRLRSSVSSASIYAHANRRPVVLPSDFQERPERTEKRFIDSIGMILPGVCDRKQCVHPRVHFVSTFRLCEPIEYTTALADHGITYTDYCRLVTVLSNFLEEATFEPKRRKNDAALIDPSGHAASGSRKGLGTSSVPQRDTPITTTEQLKKARQQGIALNELLEEITWNLQARGIPVMICVHSFSLFTPHRISEAHVQILHVTLDQMLQATLAPKDTSEAANANSPMDNRISFIDLSLLAGMEERSAPPKLEDETVPTTAKTTCRKIDKDAHQNQLQNKFQHSQSRDRSKPTPLWPNAIPSRKRQVMSINADRYGLDPYFRAWMRANINSRTRSNTFAKYMIEQEDDPFVNKRLEYSELPSKGQFLSDVLRKGSQAWKVQCYYTMNKAKYEHNRRLECRKTIEHGSRLRLVRFGFRQSIHPPHTAEMHGLGLTKDAYETILSNIDAIHTHVQLDTKRPMSYLLAPLHKIRRRSTEDALMEVSKYIRQLNASQRRIVWTIEKIPGVFDRGSSGGRTEWEISAWNGEDPLELVIQLERWGIIEDRLGVEDDD